MSAKKSKAKKPVPLKVDIEDGSGSSPAEFMRARHPDLFSDSTIASIPTLPRQVFEYHLETLTRRKQEAEFEHFARRLAEKEICPNLLPQSGPVGGGDSKVDSETFPVADKIALRWYEGIGQEASQERWGFAFSAKKDWRPKVKSDVAKILDTKREYKRIFFITNQPVRDKARAEVEDELTRKHQVDVRILDLSWIVRCVFEHNRLQLAAETLGIAGYDDTTTKEAGPRDVERQAELKELEEHINDPDRYKYVEYQLVEDCLQAALLARGLELPRIEIDGRFQRAERIAEKVGHRPQQLRVIYNKAWTTYWWYEDYNEFNTLYDRVEVLALGSAQADDLELLTNLWQLLHTSVNRGVIKPEKAMLARRTETLKAELDRLAANDQRPNNALQARTYRLFVKFAEDQVMGRSADSFLLSLKDVLEKSAGLSEYPLTTVTQFVQELGEFLTDNPKYDELLEVVVKITQQRASEGEAGKILLKRGQQILAAGKNYEAIKLLGRAQQKLAMEEHKQEWIMAVAGCGASYEAVGLLWGTRSNMLMATSLSFSEWAKHGTLPPHSLLLVQELVWIELQLGRIPYVLAWMELASVVATHLLLDDEQIEKYRSWRNIHDAILGILLLKADVSNLKWLNFLPPVLDELDLIGSWMCLVYALGYEDKLREEKIFPDSESPEEVRDYFQKWLNQPANKDLPDQPELLLGNKVTFRSDVLGCQVLVEADNNSTSIYLAEMILGALEALLATSLHSEMMPYRPKLFIVIQPSDFLSGLPEYNEDELLSESKLVIKHPLNLDRKNQKEREAFHSWLENFIIHTMLQIAVVSDLESFEDRLLKSEAGIGRALIFAEVDIAISNILGDAPKLSISDWKSVTDTTAYLFKRGLPWYVGLPSNDEEEKKRSPMKIGKSEPPAYLLDTDNMKHKDFQVISLINVPLWDKAQWHATAYICPSDQPPIVVLGFGDAEAGKLIFKEWRSKLGQIDQEDQIRLSFITGIDKKHPSHYRMVVSSNLKLMERSDKNLFALALRIKTLEPPDLMNLNNFLAAYEKLGLYRLVPGHVVPGEESYRPMFEYWIGKQEMVLRPAWQIGEHDPDVMAIFEDTDPIIPEGVKDAPVLQALQRFSKRKKRRRH